MPTASWRCPTSGKTLALPAKALLRRPSAHGATALPRLFPHASLAGKSSARQREHLPRRRASIRAGEARPLLRRSYPTRLSVRRAAPGIRVPRAALRFTFREIEVTKETMAGGAISLAGAG